MVPSTCREAAGDVRVFAEPQHTLMRQLVAASQQRKVNMHTCSNQSTNHPYISVVS